MLKLKPLKEQDRIAEGLLATQDGRYHPLGNLVYSLPESPGSNRSGRDFIANLKQDPDILSKGLIKELNGNQVQLSDILAVSDYIEQQSDNPLEVEKLVDPDKEDRFCFIATRVYGSPDYPNVEALRHFRDETLRASFLGRAGIAAYYGGGGKFLAWALPDFAVPAARRGLDYLVKRIQGAYMPGR